MMVRFQIKSYCDGQLICSKQPDSNIQDISKSDTNTFYTNLKGGVIFDIAIKSVVTFDH